ncbi:DegV family EDD domain-containing protein [Micrococcales bacterium 31B]|nr:DegV family EDD domain-containing protein [Micrococcales bacterium 31B]
MARVGIVTDASASLSREVAHIVDAADPRVRVVPLGIAIDGREVPADGARDASVLAALHDLRAVTTASPTPAAFVAAYESLEAEGCDLIISVHVSAALSATVTAARAAAGLVRVPVCVQDSRTTAFGLALVIARLREWLAPREASLDVARPGVVSEFFDAVTAFVAQASAQSYTFFVVETLAYLHRSGRLGKTALALGSALKLKPLFMLRDGSIKQAGIVRTVPRSIPRIFASFDAAAVRQSSLDVAIAHVDALPQARLLSVGLQRAFDAEGLRVRDLVVAELNPGLAAHTGPGTLAVSVMPTRVPAVE